MCSGRVASVVVSAVQFLSVYVARLSPRPLHLPLHVLVCLDSVSLSTSLVTGAPVLVLRLVTDGTYLLLAHQQYDHPDPKQGESQYYQGLYC